ncbi:MAG: hypothetical protein R3A50_04700 [Saprospiraceae bacterium]
MLKINQEEFETAKAWITENRAHTRLELHVFELWEAGSRTAVYSALSRESFSECSTAEKIIIYEALELSRSEQKDDGNVVLRASQVIA